jgi:cellulose synthase/poly-beta-1,6-N-acetylglucosamine synthase-like glycosyltransferase
MESLFKERMHPLKSNSVIKLSFFFGFIIKLIFTSLFSLRVKNCLFLKIIISLVYILIIPNRVPIVVMRKQGLNIDIVIRSFSL